MKISAAFEVSAWDEEPFDEAVGVAKLTKATVTKSYSGDVEGTSATEWLMAYHPDKSAAFVGIERIKGSIGGRKGTVVIQHVGVFENGAATAALEIISGTDELKGVSGDGKLVADPSGRIDLDIVE